MDNTILTSLKMELQENKFPVFTDSELDYYYTKNGEDFKKTMYECLILKSNDSSITLTGLSVADTSNYFKRLAMKYRKNDTQVL